MKKIILSLCLVSLVLGCSKNKEVKDPEPAPTEITSDTVLTPQSHTSKNSLDYLGLYKGKLPCADCAGIETSIELSEDFSYIMTMKYLGKSDKAIEQKGTYAWNKTGSAIVLDGGTKQPSQYFVGENTLTQLDANGTKVEGKLADSYILKKLTETQAAKTDASAVRPTIFNITGIHWKLSELNGKSVKSVKEDRDFYIEFRPDNNFSAFAGCNKMAGHYELGKDRIKFLRVMATMMACPDMKSEEQLKVALETSDNYVANEKVLQLRKGGNTLAKFDATPLKVKK